MKFYLRNCPQITKLFINILCLQHCFDQEYENTDNKYIGDKHKNVSKHAKNVDSG